MRHEVNKSVAWFLVQSRRWRVTRDRALPPLAPHHSISCVKTAARKRSPWAMGPVKLTAFHPSSSMSCFSITRRTSTFGSQHPGNRALKRAHWQPGVRRQSGTSKVVAGSTEETFRERSWSTAIRVPTPHRKLSQGRPPPCTGPDQPRCSEILYPKGAVKKPLEISTCSESRPCSPPVAVRTPRSSFKFERQLRAVRRAMWLRFVADGRSNAERREDQESSRTSLRTYCLLLCCTRDRKSVV